jgi:hypothetical protein
MSYIHCGKNPFVKNENLPENEPKARNIFFSHNGSVLSAMVKPHDTSFFKIISGKYKGNLVHIFDIVKQK